MQYLKALMGAGAGPAMAVPVFKKCSSASCCLPQTSGLKREQI